MGSVTTAVVVGAAIAVLPLTTIGLILGVIALGILSIISPLTLVICMVIIAPIRTLFATESPVQIPLDAGQWLLIGAFLVWFAHRIAFQQILPRVRVTPVFLSVLVFVVGSAFSAFSAYSMSAWITEWMKWLQILALILMIGDLAVRRAWEWIVFALVVAALTNSITGIYEYFGGSGALHLIVNERNFRAFGTFGQPNPFAGFMGLIAPLALVAAIGYGIRAWKLWRHQHSRAVQNGFIAGFYLASFGVISAGLYMSYSRGAWLGFAVSILALMAALPRKLWQGIALFAVVALIGTAAWFSGKLPASLVDRVNSATQETFSFSDVRGVDITTANYALVERLAHWQAALNMIEVHPWLGVGLGNYETAYPEFRLLYWTFPLGHAHNYYLNVFAETGIIGLVSYLILWGAVLVHTWWTTRRQPDPLGRIIAVGLLASWIYLAVHSLTDNLYVNNLFIHVGVMLGLLAALSPTLFVRSVGKRIAWGKRIPMN
ncbi:MAG: O-antigen ligase family protein [Anaerolineae bacterium]